MTKAYKDFVSDLGARESGNRYGIKNEYGYLGRFQFGMMRLMDFGMVRRIPSAQASGSNKAYEWVAPFSEAEFLSNHALQDAVFDLHVGWLRNTAVKRYSDVLNFMFFGTKLTLSGAIACMHLLGTGGLYKFVSGTDTQDANGTKASEYVKKFADYDVPATLPSSPDKADLKRYVVRQAV